MKRKDLGCHSTFMPDLPICWGPCPAELCVPASQTCGTSYGISVRLSADPRFSPLYAKRNQNEMNLLSQKGSPTAISGTTGFRGFRLVRMRHWRKREHGDSKRPECQDSGGHPVLFPMPCCLPAFLPAH